MIALLLASLAAVPAPSAPAPWECEHVAERNATIPAGGANLLRLAAAAGELRVVGREGISEVRVRGRACSSDARYLESIRLETAREGGTIRVDVRMPERSWTDDFQARLDLEIEVPLALAADITDSSGDAVLENLASLRVTDASGELRISGIRGDVHVSDSSGDVRLRGARGDVRLSDSSGALIVDEVEGGVIVDEDSSGDIEIDQVRRDVLVRRDSSGDIDVSRVGGAFTVERDGSGSIRVDEVEGTVRIPERRRRRA